MKKRNGANLLPELKVIEYITNVIFGSEFQDRVIILRKKYSIFIIQNPPKIKLYNPPKEMKNDVKKELVSLVNFKIPFINQIFFHYLYTNEISFDLNDFHKQLEKKNLVEIYNLDKGWKSYLKLKSEEPNFNRDLNHFEDKPIVLRLHPDVSRRDVVSFIEENWGTISKELEIYRNNKSGLKNIKIRKPSAFEKDKIYAENRDKSNKEINSLLAKKNFNYASNPGDIHNSRKRLNKITTKV